MLVPMLAAISFLTQPACRGYSDGSSTLHDAGVPSFDPDALAPQESPPLSQEPPPRAPVAKPPSPPPPAPPSEQPDEPAPDTNLRLASSARFDSYLTDALGRPLYMFVDDIAASGDSACVGECAREWPPFDLETVVAPRSIDRADVTRFHRQDGPWQLAYKGHPLYQRATEATTREVTGDGHDHRWFVARDYLAFMSSASTFAPSGGAAVGGNFLTDGYGRTLYVCLDDQPRSAEHDAVSSCDTACTLRRPIFAAFETARTTLLPSAIAPADLRELIRPDGQVQLTYRGWPLYYYSGDAKSGATEGHNDRAWRAIDPIAFGLVQEQAPEP
ncbi:MAG: hypothetical protein ABW321_23370 [Polyangiales bacterium]